MKLLEITSDRFPDWLQLRQKLFADLDRDHHREEMDLIHSSPEATAFLGTTEEGEHVGLMEVSLRNFVDGCLGGPVGYVEALYLEPPYRGKGEGRNMIDFAADWFRARGCRDMAADADLENVLAQKFFSHIGFSETFRIVQFKRTLENVDVTRSTNEDEDIG
ncbi:MAG: GNAT family N-acetyltransferase [Rhodothermales bacterium]|nr:GNAT family N-acetyltransferase [Rhodothermales bacterium]